MPIHHRRSTADLVPVDLAGALGALGDAARSSERGAAPHLAAIGGYLIDRVADRDDPDVRERALSDLDEVARAWTAIATAL